MKIDNFTCLYLPMGWYIMAGEHFMAGVLA